MVLDIFKERVLIPSGTERCGGQARGLRKGWVEAYAKMLCVCVYLYVYFCVCVCVSVSVCLCVYKCVSKKNSRREREDIS